MKEKLTHAARYHKALDLVWRNSPRFPTTFGPCYRGCGRGSGRGSGPCIHCATDDMIAATGSPEKAGELIHAINKVRELEGMLEDMAQERDDATDPAEDESA